MANQLKMAVVNAIRTLTQVGWSQRRIAQVLGSDRETVARHVRAPPAEAKPATNPIPGSETIPTLELRPVGTHPLPEMRFEGLPGLRLPS